MREDDTFLAKSCGVGLVSDDVALLNSHRDHRQPALGLATESGVGLAAAIDAFLSQPDLAATTRAKYVGR